MLFIAVHITMDTVCLYHCSLPNQGKENLQLGSQWKGDVVVHTTKVLNLFFCTRLYYKQAHINSAWPLPHGYIQKQTLIRKLIAWAADNGETAILVLLVQSFKTSILLGESTFRRDIHDKNHLSLCFNDNKKRESAIRSRRVTLPFNVLKSQS